MQISLQSCHVNCNKVKDLVEKHVFLNAILNLSLKHLTIYTTIVSESMTAMEKGILKRLTSKLQNHILSASRDHIRFQGTYLNNSLETDQIRLLEDLNHKCHQVLVVFETPICRYEIGTLTPLDSKLNFAIHDSIPTESELANSPRSLDTIIHNKKMESLEYFFYTSEIIYILSCEMQASYLKCQKIVPDLRYVLAYYENTLKSAGLQERLRERIIRAMTTTLSQLFRDSFDDLIENICNQAALTGGEVFQFVGALAKSYYRRSSNEFLVRWADFEVAPLNCVEYILRFRQLVMLSSVVAQKRGIQLITNNRQKSFWGVLLSTANLQDLTRRKVESLSTKYTNDIFTLAELRLYRDVSLPVPPLSRKYVTAFNEIFTDQELWRLNTELNGENLMRPLKWVYTLLLEIKGAEWRDTLPGSDGDLSEKSSEKHILLGRGT